MGQSGTELKLLPMSLILKVVDLGVETFNILARPIDGRPEFAALLLPAADTLKFLLTSSELGLDFIACLAFVADRVGGHDEFHATGLARAVLPVAVLTEVAPLPVATLEDVLIEETHVVLIRMWSRAGGLACTSVSCPIDT